MENKIVYFLENTMYLNITNKCTNDCVFCIRELNTTIAGFDPKLENKDASAEEVIAEIKENAPESRDEIVFCGYGEPLILLETVKVVAKFIKQNYPSIPVRVNTNGHASLIYKKNVVPELVGLIDKVSVSLNADNSGMYKELSRCKFDKDAAFEGVKEFIGECQKCGIDTTASIVQGFGDYEIDTESCKKIADELGVKFKVRQWLNEGYTL